MKKEEWILPYIKQNARLFVLVIFLGAVTIFSLCFSHVHLRVFDF